MPVVPEPTPARSKVERLMPRSAAHRMALSLSVAIAYAACPLAVVTDPSRMAFLEEPEFPRLRRPHENAETGIMFLLALGATPWAGHLVVARPAPSQMNAVLLKFIKNAHQWITSLSSGASRCALASARARSFFLASA